MSPTPGYIQLIWPTGTLDILLGDTSPTITEGYSIFNEITRPKRSSVIEYTGKSLFKMDLSGLFDGWISETSVDHLCQQLELLAVSRGGKGRPPQDFKIDGPVPHSNLQWYIGGITWDDAIYSGRTRIRQRFGLSLIQKLDMPYVLKNLREQPRAAEGFRLVETRSGDLRELALIMLGDATQWRRMTNKKGVKFRDWRVKPRTKVRVPK